MTRIFLSSNPENLAAELAAFRLTATVEAEFGDTVVEGSILTLAHHGARSANSAPCLASNGVAGDPVQVEAIGVSHIDLDSLGGVMAVLGSKPESVGFWALSAFVDTNGPHKLAQAGAEAADVARLYAFWAYSQAHRLMPDRSGAVTDVTEQVTEAMEAIAAILADDPAMLAAGNDFRSAEDSLNKRSFVEMVGGVGVRVADVFVSHLYGSPEGELAKAVVAFNTVTGTVTVSLADPIPGVSACTIVQGIWGTEAGGHAGIAGSPRGRRMTLADLARAAEAVREVIASTSVECEDCGQVVSDLLPGQIPDGWGTVGCYEDCPKHEEAYCPSCLPAAQAAGRHRCGHDH
ncbi:MAG: hypothetical protein WC107_04260 [Patescibacteria group bacterium]